MNRVKTFAIDALIAGGMIWSIEMLLNGRFLWVLSVQSLVRGGFIGFIYAISKPIESRWKRNVMIATAAWIVEGYYILQPGSWFTPQAPPSMLNAVGKAFVAWMKFAAATYVVGRRHE